MRIAFIDHSYHKQTLSTRFFLDLVSGLGNIQLFYDDSWRNGKNEWRAEFVENDFDLIIIWQVTEALEVLSGKHRNVVFVPMYDAMLVEGEFHWSDLFLQARCISFSRRLHRELQIRGAKSEYFKFFPDPSRFEIVSDFSELRPYFWYRSSRINLDKILSFCRENAVQQLTIHNVPDPEQEKLAIRNFDGPLPRFKISDWYNTQDEYRSELLQHNVYFAPRDVEGIGFSFLEAMASGMCVVAPDMPTMNEYISNGTNGLLYSLEKRFPVDLSKAKEIGARARETIERGFVDWQKQQKCLVDFLITPGEFLKPRSRASKSTAASESRNLPKISIVTVCLNAEQVVQKTIESVLGQDYGNFEYIILDGASTDATAKIIQWYDPHLSYWHSEKDQGVYYAMDEAMTKCTGDFILFMNAGDTLFDLAIDSKLRGCDVVKVKIWDIVNGGQIRTRAIVVQQKTSRPVQFELLEPARGSILAWLERRGGSLDEFVFPSCLDHRDHISTRQYARLVDEWVTGIGLRPEDYGTHSLRRTKASLI